MLPTELTLLPPNKNTPLKMMESLNWEKAINKVILKMSLYMCTYIVDNFLNFY